MSHFFKTVVHSAVGIFAAYHTIIIVLTVCYGLLCLCLKALVVFLRPLKKRLDAWLIVSNQRSKEGLARSHKRMRILEHLQEEKKDLTCEEVRQLLYGTHNFDAEPFLGKPKKFRKVKRRRIE